MISDVVKQKLLCVTSMRPKVVSAEILQPGNGYGSIFKIHSFQYAVNPDVDRKGIMESQSKQQDTIGNLGSNSFQRSQLSPGIRHR